MRSIINILENDAALTALIGANKVGMNIISQSVKTPYVVVDVEDSESTNSFDAPSDLDFVRLTVFSVGERPFTDSDDATAIGADEVAKSVRAAIDLGNAIAGTYDGETITRCTHERMGGIHEDRVANKTQITRTDEYLLSVRV